MTSFALVAATSEQVAATKSRNEKVHLISELLRTVEPGERSVVADYLAGVVPQGRIGVGRRSIPDAVPTTSNSNRLSVGDIDRVLSELAQCSGPGSTTRRAALLEQLWGGLSEVERHLLTGLLLGDTRQGAGDGIMLKAIAAAAQVPEATVRRAVMLAGRTGPVAASALDGAAAALDAVRLEVGRPLRPMLAGSSPDIASVLLDDPSGWSVEVKLDGIRLQAHKSGDDVRLYTRSLDDITERLPEVVEVVQALPARQVVLDGEAIALKPDGRPEPFQITGARTASRGDAQTLRERVPVSVFFFDLLHHDGADLVDAPARKRREALGRLVPSQYRATSLIPADAGAAQEFFDSCIAAGHEGVVAKALEAPYAAGRRGSGWVKVKPRHTLDLVVLAVEPGSGRRRGTLSNIHLGARDPETGDFVMLGKTALRR